MVGSDAIPAGVKHKGFAAVVLVLLHLSDKDDMISAVVLPDLAANKMRDDSLQNRHARRTLYEVDAGELVPNSRRKMSRKIVLLGFKDVDRKMGGVDEFSKTLRLPRQAPENKRRIQRDRGKRIHGDAYVAAVTSAGGHDCHSCGELAQGLAIVARVEALAHDISLLLYKLACLLRVQKFRLTDVIAVQPVSLAAQGEQRPRRELSCRIAYCAEVVQDKLYFSSSSGVHGAAARSSRSAR